MNPAVLWGIVFGVATATNSGVMLTPQLQESISLGSIRCRIASP
jgi:hypothetical protein